jgi:hypothetical protein
LVCKVLEAGGLDLDFACWDSCLRGLPSHISISIIENRGK